MLPAKNRLNLRLRLRNFFLVDCHHADVVQPVGAHYPELRSGGRYQNEIVRIVSEAARLSLRRKHADHLELNSANSHVLVEQGFGSLQTEIVDYRGANYCDATHAGFFCVVEHAARSESEFANVRIVRHRARNLCHRVRASILEHRALAHFGPDLRKVLPAFFKCLCVGHGELGIVVCCYSESASRTWSSASTTGSATCRTRCCRSLNSGDARAAANVIQILLLLCLQRRDVENRDEIAFLHPTQDFRIIEVACAESNHFWSVLSFARR